MKRRGIGQKTAFFIALLSYLGAAICVVCFFYFKGELGGDHPVIASLGASTVFFIGMGIVLHVIGRANLPSLSLKVENENKKDDGDEAAD